MPKDHEQLIDRAFANYSQRRGPLEDALNKHLGGPDRGKSFVDDGGMTPPHICIISTEGEPLAYYLIHKNGRLKFQQAYNFGGEEQRRRWFLKQPRFKTKRTKR